MADHAGRELRLVIEDDGVGMRAAPQAGEGGGQGLPLHGTMMAVIGGTLTPETREGGGTRVVLGLPLREV